MDQIRNWSIYKITNPEGRVYIGRTLSVRQRRHSHFSPKQYQNKFIAESIHKFGKQNHPFEVIDTFTGSENFANGKEMFWIRTYMSNINKWPDQMGMNQTDGGKSLKGYKFSKESNQKRNSKNRGQKRPYMSERNKARFTGVKQSPEQIKKTAEARQLPVYQYDLNGKFIKEYPSLKEAGKAVNTSAHSHIAEVCRGERWMYKKFIWKFKPKKC